MATYFWLGSVSTNVNDRRNWTTFDLSNSSGVCGASLSLPYANQAPGNGDTITFDKILISGSTYSYPIYAPGGTLMGVSGGLTAASLSSVQVLPNYPLGFGSTGTTLANAQYFNLYAAGINIHRGATNASTAAYNLNLLTEPTSGAYPVVTFSSYAPNFEFNVKGTGTVRQPVPFQGNLSIPATYGNIYFLNGFFGKIGPFLNPRGREIFHVNSTTSFDNGYPIYFSGHLNRLHVSKGFASSNGSNITFDGQYLGLDGLGDQYVWFTPENLSGITGGITAASPDQTTRSTMELNFINCTQTQVPGGVRRQTVNVMHGVDFLWLGMYGGAMIFGLQNNQPCRIFEGIIRNPSMIYLNRPEDVIIMTPAAGYKGVFISSGDVNQKTLPLTLMSGGMRVALTVDQEYDSGNLGPST